eukprot:scaffold1143_cov25-Tisochrysis_lutea.AAC.4
MVEGDSPARAAPPPPVARRAGEAEGEHADCHLSYRKPHVAGAKSPPRAAPSGERVFSSGFEREWGTEPPALQGDT